MIAQAKDGAAKQFEVERTTLQTEIETLKSSLSSAKAMEQKTLTEIEGVLDDVSVKGLEAVRLKK
jgi:hypothetical protein